MRSAPEFLKLSCCSLALALAALSGALAQTTTQTTSPTTADRQSVTASENLVSTNRSVGVQGRLRQVKWQTAPAIYLADMKLERTARRLSDTPGAMRHTKVWMARADVCSLPGEEILMQVRSPLTCGTLGCEMMVLSDADGEPRVVMQTVGDTMDSNVPDEIIINSGDRRERVWDYNSGKFRRSRK